MKQFIKIIKNENPVNNADDVSLNPLLSVEIYDYQMDTFDVTFELYYELLHYIDLGICIK